MADGLTYKSCSQLEDMNVQLFNLQSRGILTDVVLHGSDSTNDIPCHRSVLAASSDYFLTMFTSHMQEETSNIITLPSIAYEPLNIIIQFIYTGEARLCQSTVEGVLSGSHLLALTNLTSHCIAYMGKIVLH